MQWITALDLERWASTIAAREWMAALVGDLVRATSKEISAFRFPNGDKGQVRGFDGWLDAAGVGPYVPDGQSIWEFGVAGSKPSKAAEDYKKRTEQVDPEKQKQTTFVFVSPSTWDNPQVKLQDWIDARRNEGQWKEVRYLDGSQLEDWLTERPAVAAMYAVKMGVKPRSGARSTEEFWNEFAHRFRAPLTEDVVLAGRNKQASDLLQRLLGQPSAIEHTADAPDEVIAFAIAAIRKADPETRAFLEARTLVLDNEDAARFFSRSENIVFFPRGQADALSGLLATRGPTLLAKGRDQLAHGDQILPRPSTSEFAGALQTMGLDEDEAYAVTRHAGRSITVLARRFSGGSVPVPAWRADGRKLIPAMLAGGWDANSEPDREAVSELIEGTHYLELIRTLKTLARLQDPPVDLEGSGVWKIRAPVDAFVQLGHLLDEQDLERLRLAATKVFSHVEAAPMPDEPFVLPENRPKIYSNWLRDGLATTLLQLAVLNEQAEVHIPGIDPQGWVNDLITSLPGLRDNHRLIASLKSELWLLMEASPNPLLDALEHLLEGNKDDLKGLFATSDDLFSPTSPHNYVLWALEMLAWDPAYIGRTTTIIAKLAAIAPERASNRPLDSLRSIFLSWNPNTNARLEARNAALRHILINVPEIAWSLLLELLPKPHDSSIATRKPRFREAGASQAEVLTYAKVWAAQEFVVEQALALVGDSSSRWADIIARMDDWTHEQQDRALKLLDEWLGSEVVDKFPVWEALHQLVNKHSAYQDTDWAITSDRLEMFASLVSKHQPDDPVLTSEWLFDSYFPRMGANYEESERQADTERTEAIIGIMRKAGFAGALRLADRVKQPWLVGTALAEYSQNLEDLTLWIETALNEPSDNRVSLASTLSGVAHKTTPREWEIQIKRWSASSRWTSDLVAHLLLTWPDNATTWDYVESLGVDVASSYWGTKRAFRLGENADEVHRAINEYLAVGRAGAAIQASHHALGMLITPVMVRMLQRLMDEQNSAETSLDQMAGYYVEAIFSELDKREDIDQVNLARLEYAYFPLLERSQRSLAIHKLMASDPHFYHSLIESVFRKEGDHNERSDEDGEPNEQKRAKWRIDYQLLSQFSSVPGKDGEDLNYSSLSNWVSEVRELGRNTDRSTITDIYVGHVLAHAPADANGNWPHETVRELLDQISAEDVERGILTERYNMRGVFTKSLYEGGDQERSLAEQYHRWADASASWPRTFELLQRIAQGYERDAKREDDRAALDKLRD